MTSRPAVVIECQRCGRPVFVDTDTPAKARAQLSNEGWTIEDTDLCPGCTLTPGGSPVERYEDPF